MLPVPIGRGRESRILTDALDGVCHGSGGSVFVQGSAGMGKTTLVEAMIQEAAQRGVPVRFGRPLLEEQFLGYKLLTDALGTDAGSAPGRSKDGATVAVDSRQATRHLHTRLVELTRTTGLVVALDDLHHADAASLEVLVQMLPQRHLPVLWLLSSRPTGPGGRSTTKRRLARVREAAGQRVVLEPLGDADAGQLATQLLGGRPGPRLERYLARAKGNPCFMAELCRGLRKEGWVAGPESSVDSTASAAVDAPWEIPLPRSFRDLVGQSMERLPAPTRRLVRLIAVLGAEVTLGQVGSLAGSSAEDVLRTLQPAFAEGVLERDGDLLRFRHPLLRVAVYESLPLSAQLASQDRIGTSLMDTDEGRHYLAWHHLLDRARQHDALSEAVGGPRAKESATTAELLHLMSADRAVPTVAEPESRHPAPGAVAGSVPEGTLLVSRLTLQKAWAEMVVGDIRAGERVATAVLDVAGDPAVRIEALELLAESLTLQRGYAAAVPALSEAIAVSDDDEVTAGLRVGRASSLALSGSLADGMAELRQVHQTTTSQGTRARAAAARALGLVVQGHLEQAIALADEAIGFDLVDWGDPRNRACPHYALGLALLNADRWDRASDAIQQGIHCCEERERLVDLPVFLSLHATLLLLRGRWSEALSQAETGMAISESLGLQRNVALLVDVIAFIAAERGLPAAAADALMQAERILPAAAVMIGPNRLVRTKARLYDDPTEAYAHLTAAWSVADHLDAGAQLVELGPAYISAAMGADDRSLARAASRQVTRAATRLGTPYARGMAERCEGLVQGDVAALQRALSLLGRSPRALDRADTLVDFARLSAAQGKRAAARDAVREALTHYRAFGAHRSATESIEQVAALGLTCEEQPDSPVERQACLTGWDSLTPTERTVAELVAEGLSNREIARRLHVSHRTVETHVSHAFPKLGVSSRVGLAKAALSTSGQQAAEGSAG